MSDAHVRLTGVVRRFDGVTALDGADLELRAGEVHGVLGANGAGKTTLLSVLGGLLRADGGHLEIGGRRVALSSPRDAWAHGIVLVHQHFTLVPRLSVLENLALGLRLRSGLRLDLDGVRRAASAMAARTGLAVPLDARVEELGVGDRQRTEILKALLREPRVLVLDEPTAVLTPGEIEGLFDLLGDLASEGRAVALVAHKLDEVLGVADRLTVLRDGRTVLEAPREETTVDELVRAMVGGAVDDPAAIGLVEPGVLGSGGVTAGEADDGAPAEDGPAGDENAVIDGPVARLRGVVVRTSAGDVALDHVDLDVHPGEIVGVAGVEGNGQHQLALVLGGRLAPTEGTVHLPPGIGLIPQDRTTAGVIADFDLTENVALAFQRDPRFRRGPWLRWDALVAEAAAVRARYGVAAPSVRTRASALSGGNQQRVVVGRELAMAKDLLVAENPTRGLDVAASSFVHQELLRLTRGEAGSRPPGVVLVSTDLDEVIALSDRILAISRGRLVPVPVGQRTREGIGALMLAGSHSG